MSETTNINKIKKFFKKRKSDSHKGQNGKVLVIGGSRDLIGAPALAAMSSLACLRNGVDLVTIICPEKAGLVINTYSLDLIVKKVKGNCFSKKHLKEIIALEKNNDVVLIGPGLGVEKGTIALVKEVVKKTKKPIVIDADAIKACAKMKFNGNALLTPHEKEFEIFSGKKINELNISEKSKIIRETAAKHNCIILLKGKTDIISDGKKIVLNKTGNSGMTVGGTGDILAGLCAGFCAMKMSLFESAQASAFVNGKIGDSLLKEKGIGFIASDFVEKIPEWTKKLVK